MKMQKKSNYVAPTTELTHMDVESMITAASVIDERQYAGANGGSGTTIYTVSGNDSSDDDDFHNGQGYGGSGTRAKGGPWDDYSWDSWD